MSNGKIVGIGLLTSILGLCLIITSSLVLYDAIQFKNSQWDRQNLAYHPNKYGPEFYWDQLKADDDMIVILAPLSLLVGLVQLFLPALFCCLKSKDLRRMIQLWIGANGVLIFMTMSCFVLGMVYGIDTNGFKSYNYNGRQSSSYYSSWWKYPQGQAYLGVLGCNCIILLGIFIWMVRWVFDSKNATPHNGYLYHQQQPGYVTPV